MEKRASSEKISKVSILYSWTLFFVLLLIISISVSGFIYSRAVSSLSKEVAQSYQLEMDRVKYLVDEKMNEMKSIAVEQSLNSDLRELLQMKTVSPESRIIMWQLQQKLKDFCVSNSSINDIVIGFNDMNVAISNRSIYSISEVSNVLLDGQILPELQKRAYKNEFILLHTVQLGSSGTPQIAYLLSLPLEPGSENDAFVLVTIRTSSLSQLFPVDRNRIMVLKGVDTSAYINSQQATNNAGSHVPANDYRVFTTESSVGNFSYQYYVSNKEFFFTVNGINDMTIAALVACVLLFVGVLVLFLRLNYNPIHRMLKKINEQISGKAFHAKNELTFLEKSLANIFVERKNMIGEMDKQSLDLRNYFIMRLIKGELSDESSIDYHSAKYGFTHQQDSYMVAVTRITDYTDLAGRDVFPSDSAKRAKYLIVKAFEESCCDSLEIISTNFNDTIVSIIHFNLAETESVVEKIRVLGTTLHTLAGLGVTIATSQRISSLWEASYAYDQALEASEYCQLFDKSFAVYSKNAFGNSPRRGKTLSDINKRFSNCLSMGDLEAALVMLPEVSDAYFSESDSVSMLRMNIYGLIHLVSSSLISLSGAWSLQLDTDAIVYKLTSCKSIDGLKKMLCECIESIRSQYRANQENQINGLINKITAYIMVHYNQYDLSVGSIADQFNLSVPYLSRAFKKEMSVGLLEYIHGVRITEAKRLLATGDHSINDIASLVGFNDSSAFIKVFKKSEGVPPGKYTKYQVS